MVRHIVLIQFQASLSDEEIAHIWRELYEIRGKVPGLIDIRAGTSKSPEKMERGHRHGFTVDFENWEALAAYQEHPEHKKLGARLVDKAVEGIDGILVFDFET